MNIGFSSLGKGLLEIVFPHTCEICGSELPDRTHFVCRNCLDMSFEVANPKGEQVSSDTILPEFIHFQHALWNFDKGGFLQDLMHKLKYKRLTGVGEDLGKALGRSLGKNPHFNSEEDWILIPVPLHDKKENSRGFNQARAIAIGMEVILGMPIISEKSIIRVKNTRTQTGFTLEKRRENISGAFTVSEKKDVEGKSCLIVDDVFTTGATSFELASVLHEHGTSKISIATIAQA